MFRTGAQFMFLVLVFGLLLLREARQDPMREFDQKFADLLACRPLQNQASPALTLVEINSTSVKNHPLPWTPLDYALFFQAANSFQPEALAFGDPLHWDEAAGDTKLPQYKKILRDHLLRSPKVLLGGRLGFPSDPQVIPPLEPVPLIEKVRGDVRNIPEFTRIETQAEEEFRLSNQTGFTNLPDGVSSQHFVPLLFRYRGQVVPSFVLQAVILSEKLTPDDVSVEAGSMIHLADRIHIPINERGEMRVNFGVPLARCGFDELVLASAQLEAKTPLNVPLEKLKGRLLLLARTDPPAQSLGFPMGKTGSPGELFALAVTTIRNRAFLYEAPFWTQGAVLAFFVLAAFWAPRLRPKTVLLSALLSLLAYVGVAFLVFDSMVLPIVLPTGLTLFLVIYRLVNPSFPQPQTLQTLQTLQPQPPQPQSPQPHAPQPHAPQPHAPQPHAPQPQPPQPQPPQPHTPQPHTPQPHTPQPQPHTPAPPPETSNPPP